ncbi:hypothetical protein [Aureimonas glaciei]|nr:hypothetical protein [Aureimonas glaciei]
MTMWESFWNTTWEILGPFYAAVLPIAASAVVGYLVKLYRDKTGQEVNAIFREALQGAITRTANAIVVKAGGAAALNALPADALDLGVRMVKEAVPEAVAHFAREGLTDENIASKILPQAEAIIAAAPLAPAAMEIAKHVEQALTDPTKVAPDIGKVLDQIIRSLPPRASGNG